MSRRGRNVLGAFVAVLVVAALAVGLIQLPDYISRLTYAAETGRAQAAKEQLATANQLSQAFKNVVKAIRPSVVSINSIIRREIPDRGPRSNPQVPEEFRQFFGDDFFERFFEHRLPPGDREQRGLGTGVIISPDGHIVTNNHVVRGATELKVTLFNGRTYTAEVVGADAKTDLAVLKIDAQGLQPAEFADSDAVEVGEWVLAVGNPFELIDTVTAGIVSAKGRGVGITDYEDFVQTDAAINPGNSGGPLVNLQGQVIGICTAIATRSGGYQGVGFAIPSNMVTMVAEAIRTTGHVQRGQLGALIQDLTPDLAESFGYEGTAGVLIGDVLPDSPAAKAGLQSEDIVISYNGEPVSTAQQLRNRVAGTAPGTTVKIEVFRASERKTLEATIGELTDDQPIARAARGEQSADVLGVTVANLTEEVRRRLNIESGVSGVVITEVRPGGLAASVGLEPGDLILKIDNEEIKNVEDFRNAISRERLQAGVRIQVMRDGVRRFIFLRTR